MTIDSNPPQPCDNLDPNALEEAVAKYIDHLTEGEQLDDIQILMENPGIGHEILERLERFIGLDAVGKSSLPLGTLGDYTLRRQIGRGGMGIVYDAWQNSMEREVALKVLPAGVAADNTTFHRFMREAKTAGQLDHQSIVSVHALGIDDNTPYYAMELVKGETLAQMLPQIRDEEVDAETRFGKKDDTRYFANIAEAFADVADGLQHAHSKGVIHRDIKPSNLILDPDGRLRILDFGLARLEGQESLTLSGDLVGTPAYMSPEQAKRRKIAVDHRTDVYSLGATLYELLTHQQPFRGKDHQDTLSKIIARDPVEPRRLNSRVPRDLETVVLKCLRKEPEDRYLTAEALAQDLRRFVRGDPVEARPESVGAKLARKVWSHRTRFALGATVLLLVLVCGWLAYFYHRESFRLDSDQYKTLVESAVVKLELAEEFRRTNTRSGGEERPWRDPVHEALRKLGSAVDLFPDRIGALYHMARALEHLERTEHAREMLQRIQRLDPEFLPAAVLAEELAREGREADVRPAGPKTKGEQGWEQEWYAARKAVGNGRWDEAVKAYGKLIQLEPEGYLGLAVEARLERGRAELKRNDLEGALADFSVATALWPELPEPALLLGRTYLLMKRPEKAQEVFERLHQRSSVRDGTARIIARIYHRLGAWKGGLAWARKIEQPAFRERQKADFFRHLGQREEALKAAQTSVDLDPESAFLFNQLGLIHGDRGERDEAISNYGKALRIDPEFTPAYGNRATALLKKGDRDRALADWEKVLEINPNDAGAHYDIGKIRLAQERFEDAEKEFRKAIELAPKDDGLPYGLGKVRLAQERFEDAEKELRKAIELNPTKANRQRRLGMALEGQGRLDEAVDAYRAAVKLDPGYPSPHYDLGNLLRKDGKLDQAIDEYRKAIEKWSTRKDYSWIGNSVYGLADCLRARGDLEEALSTIRDVPDRKLRSGNSRDVAPEDLRWLLERLVTGGAVRINCGGQEYKGEAGIWGKDRFFLGGRPGGHTEDDPLFQTARSFPGAGESEARYGIPLPDGKYRVTLRFAGKRPFEVRLEGKAFMRNIDSSGASHECSVKGGMLDIEFIRRMGDPMIAAIEIVRIN